MNANIEAMERKLQLLVAQADAMTDETLKNGFLNAARECNIRLHQLRFFHVIYKSQGASK